MKSPYVNELEPNKVITTSFLVHSKEIRQKKTGEPYLSLLLADRTGELDAKMWDNVAEIIDDFDRDDFVKAKGMLQVFHNRPQLTIHKLRRLDESEIDFGDYFPSSRRDSAEMWSELRGIVAGIGNPHLRGLLDALLDDEEIARRIRRAPAAKQIHHAYLGGLIEHVLSVCAMARLAASHYRNIDCDLLLTGVVLHDIGKIYELNYERGFSYSAEGQLLGHMQIGLRMMADKLRDLPQFPTPLRTLIEHMILSHHGHLEFGSPKLPQFPEALLLHYLDDLDSKMECMRALIENDRQVEGCFTSYSSALERTALKKDRFWNVGEPLAVPVRQEKEVVSERGGWPAAIPEAQPALASLAVATPAVGLPAPIPIGESATAAAIGPGTPPEVQPVAPALQRPAAPAAPHPGMPASQGAGMPSAARSPMSAPQRPAMPANPVAPPGAQPVAQPTAAAHPLFAPKPDSPFADKLKQALDRSSSEEAEN
jgi:3'-5' exoribonuclease